MIKKSIHQYDNNNPKYLLHKNRALKCMKQK